MRFLTLLPQEEQRNQVDLMIDACELELARLTDLRDPGSDEHYFQEWLENDIDLAVARLDWFRDLRKRV